MVRKVWDPNQGHWTDGNGNFVEPDKDKKPDAAWRGIALAVVLLAGISAAVWVAAASVGESGEPDSAVEVSPSPTLTKEEAITQQLASFIASHPETEENINVLQLMIQNSGCDFSEASLTTKEKRRDAVKVLNILPPEFDGALAQVTYGEEKGSWLVLAAQVECGETSPIAE